MRRVAFDFAIRPVDADFPGEYNAVPAAVQAHSFTHNRFGPPIAVDWRGIDQIDAVVECPMNGANGFLLVGSAPHPAPMAQVPSAIRELIRFVPLISIYSCMLSLVLSCSWVSQAAQHAGWDAIAMGQVFQFVELRLWFVYLLLQNFNASFGGDSDIAFIEAYSTRCFP